MNIVLVFHRNVYCNLYESQKTWSECINSTPGRHRPQQDMYICIIRCTVAQVQDWSRVKYSPITHQTCSTKVFAAAVKLNDIGSTNYSAALSTAFQLTSVSWCSRKKTNTVTNTQLKCVYSKNPWLET